MWLDPDSVRLWMRPSEARMMYAELHPVVGGTFRFELQESDGHTFVHQGQYLEIHRPRKLRFTWQSTVLGARLSQVTIEFHEQDGQCLLVLMHDLPEDDALFQDHRRGWALILDRFTEAYRIQ